MAFDPKEVKSGDPISAGAYNDLGREVKGLGQIWGGDEINLQHIGRSVAGTVIRPEEMDFKITAGPDSNGGYDWAEYIHQTPNTWTASGATGSASGGDAAYPREWVGSVHCPYIKDTTRIFHAVRAPGSGAWMFNSMNGPFIAKATGSGVSNNSTGNVVLYDQVGGTSGPTVTATNEWATSVPANHYTECFLRNGLLYILAFDC